MDLQPTSQEDMASDKELLLFSGKNSISVILQNLSYGLTTASQRCFEMQLSAIRWLEFLVFMDSGVSLQKILSLQK